jgi:hypothetical protein
MNTKKRRHLHNLNTFNRLKMLRVRREELS